MAKANHQQDLHHEILQLLLDRVRDDAYPSVTMLDMIEQALTPDDVTEYADILMEKVRADEFPSLDHLRRLQRFA